MKKILIIFITTINIKTFKLISFFSLLMEQKNVYIVGSPHFRPGTITDLDEMRCGGGFTYMYLRRALLRTLGSCLPSLDIFLEQFYREDLTGQSFISVFEHYKRRKDKRAIACLKEQAGLLFKDGWLNDYVHAQLLIDAASLPSIGSISFRYNESVELIEAPIEERDRDIAFNVLQNGGANNLIFIGSAHSLELLIRAPVVLYRVDFSSFVHRNGYEMRGRFPTQFRDSLDENMRRIMEEMEGSPLVGPLDVTQELEFV